MPNYKDCLFTITLPDGSIKEFKGEEAFKKHLAESEGKVFDTPSAESKKSIEGVAYHGETGKKGAQEAVYLGDKELASSYAEGGGKVKEVRYKIDNPFVVDSDEKSKVIADLAEKFQKENPESRWHPDTTNYINKELKKMGYDGLVIKKEALETEYGYDKIGGTYGDPQVVLFSRDQIKTEDGKSDLIKKALDHANEVKGFYSISFKEKPAEVLQEMANQLHDPASAKEARKSFGDAVSDIALQMYPEPKQIEGPIDPSKPATASNLPPEAQASQEKVYEQIAGTKPNTASGRIPVDPITGGTPKDISSIIKALATDLGQKISFLKPFRNKAIGTYAPGSTGIKIRFAGDLDTTAHEVGHALDDKFSLMKDMMGTPIEKELMTLTKYGGSKPPKGHPEPKKYMLAEGFAEWLRGYVVNPDKAIKDAPETYKLWEEKVDQKTKDAINKFSFDVRTFAGASGRDITLANVEWKPEKEKGLMSRIFNRSENTHMFSVSWADKIAANFLNPMRAFEKAFNYAKGLKGMDEVLPSEDPTVLARLLLGIDGKYGDFLENGLRDVNDNQLLDKEGNAKNIKWLIEPLDNTDRASIERDMQDTIAYMIAERTVELGARFGRESTLSGVGGGVFKDTEVAKKTLAEFNEGDPDKLARIQEAAARYREYATDVMQYMVDKGRLSEEQFKAITQNNLQYVAMHRIIETEPGQEIEVFSKGKGGKLGSVSQPISSIKGSSKKITNPYTSLLDGMYKSIKEADRNNVLVQFRNMIENNRSMYTGDVQPFAEIGQIAKSGDKNAISIFVDGKEEKWVFQSDIYKALKGLDADGYKLPGVLTWHGRILRATVTKFPTFAVRNWIRDFSDRIIKSNEGSGAKEIFGRSKDWSDVNRNGGLNSGLYTRDKEHYYGLMEHSMNEIAKKKNTIFADPSRIKELWHGYENMLQKGETSNRVAEYRAAFQKAKGKGMDDYNASLYASYKTRDLIDFAVMGHYMRVINQLIPFSNAAIQGMRSTAVRAAEKPMAFAARMMIYSTMPQVAVWMWNHRNKEDGEQYENLPAYQRDMYWNIKIGDNKWLAIPKPYELGIPAAGIDRLMSKAWGAKSTFEGYTEDAISLLSPFSEGNLAGPGQPFVEAAVNYDFFRQKNIIPKNEDGLDLSLRNTENASRIGLALQDLVGIDARKIDHVIRSQFSYVGNFAMKVSNIGSDKGQHFDTTDTGLMKASPAYNSPAVQDLTNFAEKWDLTHRAEYRKFRRC